MNPLIELLALETIALVEAVPIVAAPDRYAAPVEELLGQAIAAGGEVLCKLAKPAVTRLLAGKKGRHLFTDDELTRLADELGALVATAHLLGRSLLADHGERVRRRKVRESRSAERCGPFRGTPLVERLLQEGVQALAPAAALDFFRGLIPTLGTDPLRLLPDFRRSAFTLAVAVERELLDAVQAVIADRLQSGDTTTGPRAVAAVLDAAGVSPKNPRYAETVWRTNAMDSYNQGLQDQLHEEAETFPVWRYSNPRDSRSRPWHAEKNGNYYPTSLSFNQVRGTEPEDVMNCRCTPIPIDKWEWAELQSQGVRLAA